MDYESWIKSLIGSCSELGHKWNDALLTSMNVVPLTSAGRKYYHLLSSNYYHLLSLNIPKQQKLQEVNTSNDHERLLFLLSDEKRKCILIM